MGCLNQLQDALSPAARMTLRAESDIKSVTPLIAGRGAIHDAKGRTVPAGIFMMGSVLRRLSVIWTFLARGKGRCLWKAHEAEKSCPQVP